MRVLIIHNQLWAHYKSKLFSDIYANLRQQYPDSLMLVGQIALYESSRKEMQDDQEIRYDYPYQVLFRKSLDEVPFSDRLKSVFRIFQEFQPDVLNITGYFDPAQVLVMLYAKMRGVKVVISSESSAADNARSGLKESLKRYIIRRADAFFCFGETSAEYLESLGAQPKDIATRNAAVIDEQVVRSAYQAARVPDRPKRRFVYVGRLASEKNLDMLLTAFHTLTKNGGESAGWQLWFVGLGPQKDALENLVAQYNLEKSVSFKGGFPWYKVPQQLAECDVLILPSKSEPWGLVVNEAMTCGMPVIVSEKCGCAADLVRDLVNGFIFDPENALQLQKAMQYFIDNPERIEAMGQESLKLIAPFSSPKVASDMVETYARLAKNNGTR